MPRHCKRRRICEEPFCESFGPLERKDDTSAIRMTLDEYETIRLIDLEALTQEQCAEQMNVARATIQSIYASARAKLADCLINGRELNINGGEIAFCGGDARGCARLCRQHYMPHSTLIKEENTMRIAVAYDNGAIFQHFGHTGAFKLYDVDGGKVLRAEVVSTNGSGHGALAGLLRQLQVNTLICGGIGAGAQAALKEASIKLCGGVTGEADKAVDEWLAGTLQYMEGASCDHHANGEHHHQDHGDHACGEHGCGEHEHGHHDHGDHACGEHGCDEHEHGHHDHDGEGHGEHDHHAEHGHGEHGEPNHHDHGDNGPHGAHKNHGHSEQA